MMRKLVLLLLSLSVPVLSSGCTDEHAEVVDKEFCRANMNTLATDLIMYHMVHGEWPEELSMTDEGAGRRAPLVCPTTGEQYAYELTDSGYIVSCPCGEHGFVSMGRPSWVQQIESGSE